MNTPYGESSRDDPEDCKLCDCPLAGDNNTGICYECRRKKLAINEEEKES